MNTWDVQGWSMQLIANRNDSLNGLMVCQRVSRGIVTAIVGGKSVYSPSSKLKEGVNCHKR